MARCTATGDKKRFAAALAKRGFTLIELVVVMAIVALLVAIAAPRYVASVDNAHDQSLRTSLRVMRDAIDQYYADKGRYPGSLQELRDARYLREIPIDPMTQRSDSWVITTSEDGSDASGMIDVRSGSPALDSRGEPYAQW
jgi:general secretion pathway protein G